MTTSNTRGLKQAKGKNNQNPGTALTILENEIDPFTQLPQELLVKIWSYLDFPGLKAARGVNSFWKELSAPNFREQAVIVFHSGWAKGLQFHRYIKDYPTKYLHRNFKLYTSDWEEIGGRRWYPSRLAQKRVFMQKNLLQLFSRHGQNIKRLEIRHGYHHDEVDWEICTFFRDILTSASNLEVLHLGVAINLRDVPLECHPIAGLSQWSTLKEMDLLVCGRSEEDFPYPEEMMDQYSEKILTILRNATNITTLGGVSPIFYAGLKKAVERGDSILPKLDTIGFPDGGFLRDTYGKFEVHNDIQFSAIMMLNRPIKKLYCGRVIKCDVGKLFQLLESVKHSLETFHVTVTTGPVDNDQFDFPIMYRLKELVIRDDNYPMWAWDSELASATFQDFLNLGRLFKNKTDLESRLPQLHTLEYITSDDHRRRGYMKGIYDGLFPPVDPCRVFPQFTKLRVTYPTDEEGKEYKMFAKRLSFLFPNVHNRDLN